MGGQAYAQAFSALRPGGGEEHSRLRVERAVGLLAGRARCRLAEAHRHLLRMAAGQRCDVEEMAGKVIQLLDTSQEQSDLPALIATLARSETLKSRATPWLTTVQGVLDALPGMSGYFVADRDEQGRLADLVWAAASPGAVTPDGRRGSQLLGLPVSRHYPQVTAAERCAVVQYSGLEAESFERSMQHLAVCLTPEWEEAVKTDGNGRI